MKKRVLVTGGAGFIGYHLLKALHQRGDFALGLDNFNTYYTPILKRERQKLLLQEEITVVEGDCLDAPLLETLLDEHQITHVVHLAAQAGVRTSLEKPLLYTKNNIDAFVILLEALKTRPHIPLTYASSSSVYGNNKKIPFTETDPLVEQASLYGVTKRTCELLAKTYCHLYGIRSTGLRFFTVYGPWGRPDMAYFSFASKLLHDKPITLYNHGNMQRDFTYIDDIIQGTVQAIDHEGSNEIFNLGNHTPVPLLHFVTTLENHLSKQGKHHLIDMQKGDVTVTYADTSYSHAKLGFTPKTSLDEGLKHFSTWFLSHGKSYALL